MTEGYNDKLSADEQISAEEWIAAYLFENDCDVERGQAESMSEECCQELSRHILLGVLTRFRPDMVGEISPTLNYDPAYLSTVPDIDLTADQLSAKYEPEPPKPTVEGLLTFPHVISRWGEHPRYTSDDWQEEAGQGNTRLGYWDWVQHQLEMNAENEEEEAE